MTTAMVSIPPVERGACALGTAVRCAAEAASAHVVGLPAEHARQLEAARDLLAEAERIATVHGDDELIAAVTRAGAIVRVLATVPT
jgi:hypothetical protein